MRKASIAATAVVMCLSFSAVLTTAQGTSATLSPPLTTIGQPADNGARIVLVETLGDRARDLTIERHRERVRAGDAFLAVLGPRAGCVHADGPRGAGRERNFHIDGTLRLPLSHP